MGARRAPLAVLAALVAGLLVVGVAAAAVEASDRRRATGLSVASAPGVATPPEGSVRWNVAPSPTFHRTNGEGADADADAESPERVAPVVAHPRMFNVERERPRIDELLRERLRAAAPDERLRVFVHGADAAKAATAAERAGLVVLATFAKVGVAAAAGTPHAVRKLTTVKGVSFVEAERRFTYAMETATVATRSAEARKGFDVTYFEPQPDKPGTSKKVCTTKRVRNKRTGSVRRVRSCRTVTTPTEPQPPVLRTQHSAGVDGSGVTIAVIDSGVDATHPMFRRPDGSSKVVRNLRHVPGPCGIANCGDAPVPAADLFVPADDTDTFALGGHGTHVSGIAAGVDVITRDGRRLHGVAPGASLVVLGLGASVLVLDPSAALDWVVEHHRDPCGDGSCPPIRVVNNSWGGGGGYDSESIYVKQQRALVAEGVVVVWAAGNGGGDGTEAFTNPPGRDATPGIVMVGSYNDAGNGTRQGHMNNFSSRGKKGEPTTYPDVAAPGYFVTSACRATLTICREGNTSDLTTATSPARRWLRPTWPASSPSCCRPTRR